MVNDYYFLHIFNNVLKYIKKQLNIFFVSDWSNNILIIVFNIIILMYPLLCPVPVPDQFHQQIHIVPHFHAATEI